MRPSGAVAAQGQARFPGRTAGKPCLTLSGPASSGVPVGVVGTALACTLDLPRVVRGIDGYTEVNVDLLGSLVVGRWSSAALGAQIWTFCLEPGGSARMAMTAVTSRLGLRACRLRRTWNWGLDG